MIDYPDKRHSARQDQRRNFHPTLQSKHGADIIKPYWKLQERSTRSHTKANPPKLQQISKKKLKARRPWSNELKIIKKQLSNHSTIFSKASFHNWGKGKQVSMTHKPKKAWLWNHNIYEDVLHTKREETHPWGHRKN